MDLATARLKSPKPAGRKLYMLLPRVMAQLLELENSGKQISEPPVTMKLAFEWTIPINVLSGDEAYAGQCPSR